MNSLSKSHILLSYIAIPIGMALVLFDGLFFSRSIQAQLPTDPHSLFLINLLFGLPHVIAGNIQMLDRSYISHYQNALLVCLFFSLFFPSVLIIGFGLTLYITVEYAVSTFHAAGQQMGIASFFGQFDRKYFKTWKASSCLMIPMVALCIGRPDLFLIYYDEGVKYIIYGLMLIHLMAGGHMILSCEKWLGVIYIGFNITLTHVFFLFNFWGYPFLSILVLRLPHDITAFLFYINHSTLRNKDERHNWIVRLLRIPTRIGGYFLPFLAVIIAYITNQIEAAFIFSAFLSYMHYTMETFVWKSKGPNLKYINLV
jgi:hypothetical protein